ERSKAGERDRVARLRCAVALARPLRRAPPSTAPKGLHEKCPAAALRAASNRASIRPSSRALHLSTFRANAAPSGFCISLLDAGRSRRAEVVHIVIKRLAHVDFAPAGHAEYRHRRKLARHLELCRVRDALRHLAV